MTDQAENEAVELKSLSTAEQIAPEPETEEPEEGEIVEGEEGLEAEDEEIEEEDQEEEEDDESPEIEMVEVELADGSTVSIPKELEDQRMMQSDYTKKTQGVSTDREHLEAEKRAFGEVVQKQQANYQLYNQLHSFDEALKQYEEVDWVELAQQAGADHAKAHQSNARELAQQRKAVLEQIETSQKDIQVKQSEMLQGNLEQIQTGLKRAIPDFAPDSAKKLAEHAIKSLQVPEQVMRDLDSGAIPAGLAIPFLKAAHDSMQLAGMKRGVKKNAGKKVVQPIKTPRGKKAASPNSYSKNLTPEQRIGMWKKK